MCTFTRRRTTSHPADRPTIEMESKTMKERIEAYQRLVEPHVASFDDFLEGGIERVVKRIPPMEVRSLRDSICEMGSAGTSCHQEAISDLHLESRHSTHHTSIGERWRCFVPKRMPSNGVSVPSFDLSPSKRSLEIVLFGSDAFGCHDQSNSCDGAVRCGTRISNQTSVAWALYRSWCKARFAI